MSLVENYISQISNNGLSGISKPLGFDMSDNTFSNLLENSLKTYSTQNNGHLIGGLGMPAGMEIEPFDADESMKIANKEPVDISDFQIKEIDMGDYFSNALKTSSAGDNGIFDMTKRQAATAYNLFGKEFVSSLKDFVGDIASMM